MALVQLTVCGDITEAEEVRTILGNAGIDSVVEPAVEHHPSGVEDAPQKVLVEGTELEAAQNAIEALSEPDDILAD
jgi:hypothetical protein